MEKKDRRQVAAAMAAALVLLIAGWQIGEQVAPAMALLSAEKELRMPVLMYHSIHSDPAKTGDYVITPEALEYDLQYLQQQGYTSVVMSDVIAYVQEGTPLPEKPVMITFDDGYYNNYLNAYPLLQKYEMQAVISIIVGETDKYSAIDENRESYSHLTWDMVNEMIESGTVEIQNHSYDLHHTTGSRRGVCQRGDETAEQYRKAVGEDLQKAQDRIEEMTGWRPNTFTYPFGSYSSGSEALLEELGFSASLGVEGRPFYLSRNAECLIRIPRYNRTGSTTAQQLLGGAFPTAQRG